MVERQGSITVIEKVTDFVTEAYGEGKDAVKVPVCTPTSFKFALSI